MNVKYSLKQASISYDRAKCIKETKIKQNNISRPRGRPCLEHNPANVLLALFANVIDK